MVPDFLDRINEKDKHQVATVSYVTLLLGPACDFWLLPSYTLSAFSLLSPLTRTFLPWYHVTHPDLLPFLEGSKFPARLSHSTVASSPLSRFNFWLPSSCPGSCIPNPFLFLSIRGLHVPYQTLSAPESPALLYQILRAAHSNSIVLDPAPPAASIRVVSEWRSFPRPSIPCSY